MVKSLEDVNNAFCILESNKSPLATLLFLHPEIRPNLSQDEIPIVPLVQFTQNTLDQLNNQWEFLTVADHLCTCKPKYKYLQSGDILNEVTRVMQLTRGKLLKQPDWNDWQKSELFWLDQYDKQGMFRTPVLMNNEMAVLHSVWTYAIKALDSHKKARWACDGSLRSGQAKILDETYANCVDQTSSRLFYAISVVENLLIFGTDVSNAFAKAPPLNKVSTFIQTEPFGNGGSIIRSGRLYPPARCYQFCWPCKAIRNPLGCGKSMLMQFFGNVVSVVPMEITFMDNGGKNNSYYVNS
jgi:hypothetical protein